MSHFKTTTQGSTSAAIQARQMALENQLREDSRTVAARVIETHGTRNQWPKEDVSEVLSALGLDDWST